MENLIWGFLVIFDFLSERNRNTMNCVVIGLSLYSVICTLVIVILGSLLAVDSNVEGNCKNLQVDGPVTEVTNKVIKFDILNQDNSGVNLGEEGKCPACTNWLTLLEILALVVLGFLSCVNLGRFGRYLKKLHEKRKLKTEEEKSKEKAKMRETLLKELDMEHRLPRSVGKDKDDKIPTWEQVTLA